MFWQTTNHRIDLSRPLVMGIVNTTPDSFSDGGKFADARAAADHCRRLIDEGADILDIGGESSRPGADPVPLEQERTRVMPVLEAALVMGLPVSLDTTKPALMAQALALGVDIINDINALNAPGALDTIAAHPSCGVCLMHMQGDPKSMQQQANYADVVEQVSQMLSVRVDALRSRGVAVDRIVLDPGIGFGKTVDHNFELLRRQRELLVLGLPLLAGWSRKSSIGAVTGRDPADRLAGSVAAALAAVLNGASVVRVHDVAATVDALKVWRAAGLPAAAPQISP
ncbi:MAG: dihydropteroate synthase [Burkholderiaceae bacterium]|nr:dihydropteroate synthase [Burkholderiaceae bacterium]